MDRGQHVGLALVEAFGAGAPLEQEPLALGGLGQLVEGLVAHPEHADLRWVVGDHRAETLRARFRGEGFAPDGEHYFLVDPLGNLMMFYDLSMPTTGMMKDLRKLLKVSQIG